MTGALSGSVSLRARIEERRFSVRLRVDMAGLDACSCTDGVEGDVVPRWIMLEEGLASASGVSSSAVISPRVEAAEPVSNSPK